MDPGFVVRAAGSDGALYGVHIRTVYVMRAGRGSWRVLATLDDLPVLAGYAAVAFHAIAVAKDGSVYVSAANGVAQIAPGNPRWLVAPARPATYPVDGTSPTEDIRHLAIDIDGTILTVADLQVGRLTPTGVETVLLDATTGKTTESARVAPTTRFAAAAVSPKGDVYILDTHLGRLLRRSGDGLTSLVLGPPSGSKVPVNVPLPTAAFGKRGERVAPADRVALMPVLIAPRGGLLDIGAAGQLFIALGRDGLVEFGDVDSLPGR